MTAKRPEWRRTRFRRINPAEEAGKTRRGPRQKRRAEGGPVDLEQSPVSALPIVRAPDSMPAPPKLGAPPVDDALSPLKGLMSGYAAGRAFKQMGDRAASRQRRGGRT